MFTSWCRNKMVADTAMVTAAPWFLIQKTLIRSIICKNERLKLMITDSSVKLNGSDCVFAQRGLKFDLIVNCCFRRKSATTTRNRGRLSNPGISRTRVKDEAKLPEGFFLKASARPHFVRSSRNFRTKSFSETFLRRKVEAKICFLFKSVRWDSNYF